MRDPGIRVRQQVVRLLPIALKEHRALDRLVEDAAGIACLDPVPLGQAKLILPVGRKARHDHLVGLVQPAILNPCFRDIAFDHGAGHAFSRLT